MGHEWLVIFSIEIGEIESMEEEIQKVNLQEIKPNI